MKKKMVSLVLCVVLMCIALVGCGKSTASIINNALKNTKNMDSMLAEMNLEMNMEMGDASLSVPLTAYIAAKDLKTEKPISYTTVTMTMMEQEINMELYQEGSDGYVIIEDMKYKTNISENNSSYDYKDDVKDILQDIPKELLKDVETVKGEDGSLSVEIAIDDEKFAEIYNDFIAEIGENAGATADSQIKISNAIVKITVNDGYISVYEMQFTMDITVEGTTATTGVKASVNFNDPGKEINITPPEDYKNFEEISLGT